MVLVRSQQRQEVVRKEGWEETATKPGREGHRP